MFFQSTAGLLRVLISALLTYAAVVALVRLTGKRSTSQLNNFDWIVTVAIGSIIGSTIISKSIPLLEGLVGIITLFGVQYLVTKLSTLSPSFSSAIHAEPTIVFFRGRFIEEAMHRERITKQEVFSALRESGVHRLSDAEAVVLESDAKFSVLSTQDDDGGASTTLHTIQNYPEDGQGRAER